MGFLSEGCGGTLSFFEKKGFPRRSPPFLSIDYGSSIPMITMPTAATAMEA